MAAPVAVPNPVARSSARLWISILGPVDVWVDGVQRRLGSAKVRALLAALALQSNRVVAVPQLLGALWDNSPPPSAEKNLHSYVYRLRRLLSAANAADRLRRHAHGYQLVVGPDELDLTTFDSLVRRARQAAQAQDRLRAVVDYRRARDLWRGQALADAAESGALIVAGRHLDERLLGIVEEHVQTGLELGRAAEMVADLEEVVGAHPLRERFRELLMLALCQLGRRADALAVYRDTRRVLSAELGIEPGPALQSLQGAILRGELAGPRVLVTAAEPAPIPAPVGYFVGRQAELARLTPLAQGAPGGLPLLVVYGPAGCGKTALALHAAHRLAGRFPGGARWASLRTHGTGRAPPPPDARGPVLVVLDDVRDADQVRRLLPAGPGAAVLVTCRRPLPELDGAEHVALDVFSHAEAVALLARLAGVERVDAEPGAAAAIVGYCGLLPLAVRIAGARLAARPAWRLADFAARLAEPSRRLDELAVSGASTGASIAASVTVLAGTAHPAARVAEAAFGLIGEIGPAAVHAEAVAGGLRVDRRTATEALDLLTDFGLLRSPAPDRYEVPELVWLVARRHPR